MLSAQAYNSELSDACVGCTVYSSRVPTYQYKKKHVSNAKESVKKPFQTQIPQAQAHNQPSQECAGHCSKKDLYGICVCICT